MTNLIIQLLLALQTQNHDAICKAAHEMTELDLEVSIQVLESIEPKHAFDYCF